MIEKKLISVMRGLNAFKKNSDARRKDLEAFLTHMYNHVMETKRFRCKLWRIRNLHFSVLKLLFDTNYMMCFNFRRYSSTRSQLLFLNGML